MGKGFTLADMTAEQRLRLEALIPFLDIEGLQEARVIVYGARNHFGTPETYLRHLLELHAVTRVDGQWKLREQR